MHKTIIFPVVLHGRKTWSLKEEHNLEVSENKGLRNVRITKSRRIRWSGDEARK
jgi:hypothetical protein